MDEGRKVVTSTAKLLTGLHQAQLEHLALILIRPAGEARVVRVTSDRSVWWSAAREVGPLRSLVSQFRSEDEDDVTAEGKAFEPTGSSAPIMQMQLERFRVKFAREPGPEDPVFLHPEAEEPRPLPESKLADIAAMIEEMGFEEEFRQHRKSELIASAAVRRVGRNDLCPLRIRKEVQELPRPLAVATEGWSTPRVVDR